MILKGSQRGGAQALALHLLNSRDNDHVELHSVNGFIAEDLSGALQEIHGISRASKCKQYMFSLSLSPPQDAVVSDQGFLAAIEQSMAKLGLSGQPHVVVFHEKNGRRHCHAVISRIETAEIKAINLPFYKERLCELSRELYLSHGWDLPKGHENRAQSDPLNYTLEEYQVAKRAKRDPKKLKALLQNCWAQSDSKHSFEAALHEAGFALCHGDRRGFVALDRDGNIYSLSRWLGVKSKDLRARIGLPELLQSLDQGQAQLDAEPAAKPNVGSAGYKLKLAGLLLQQDRIKTRQRQERRVLQDKLQEQKHVHINAFNKANSSLSGLWNWLNSRHQKRAAAHKAVLDRLAETAQSQTLHLSKQHRDERRALQDTFTKLQNWRDATLVPKNTYSSRVPEKILSHEEQNFAKRIHRDPTLILDLITDKKGLFTRADIARALSKYITDPKGFQGALATVMASDELLIRQDGSTPVYSTRELNELEGRLLGQAQNMAERKTFDVSAGHLKSAIQAQNTELQKAVGASLSDEQTRSITHLVNRRQLSAVIGYAGAGKSTMLSAARQAWQTQGYRVLGAALSGKAADGLQQASGISSRTLASYELSWKNGRSTLQPGDVLVIDEAGMIGSRQMARFVEMAHKSRAKLILVGDPDQLQPINAGTPFRAITDKIGASRLTEIRRQRIEWQRAASLDLAKGHVTEALAAYNNNDAIQFEGSQDNAITALVEDYMADCELNGAETSRLALAHRRADVQKLNETIRLARKSAGELSGERSYKTNSGPRSFAPGDRIMFTQNDRELGVKNGTIGTIETVASNKIQVTLDQDDSETLPRQITIPTNRYTAIEHGYATTIHKSQGATIDNTYVLASRSMDKNLTYVALTRHRSTMQIFVSREEFETDTAMARCLGRNGEAVFDVQEHRVAQEHEPELSR